MFKYIFLVIPIFLMSCTNDSVVKDFVQKRTDSVSLEIVNENKDSLIQDKEITTLISCDRVLKEFNDKGSSDYFDSLKLHDLHYNNCISNKNYNLLHYGILNSYDSFTVFLLDAGFSVDTVLRENGLSIFEYYSIFGDLELVKLLSKYINGKFRVIETRRNVLKNILSIAIENKKTENALWLLNFEDLHEIKTSRKEVIVEQPILKATEYGNLLVFRYLANSDVNLLVKKSYGGGDCYPCLSGSTVIHLLASNAIDEEITSEDKRVFLSLIKKNVDNLFAENDDGDTPMDIAAYSGDTLFIEFLMEHKSFKQEYLNRALMSASTFSQSDIVRFLLKKGADPNYSRNGINVLDNSISCCGDGFGDGITIDARIQTIKHLIKYGLNISQRSERGRKNILNIKARKGLWERINE